MRGPDARALILTAGMPAYSPGGLVKNISELPLKSLEMLQVLRNVHNRLLTFPAPTILHSTPPVETSYDLTLRAARTLLERFRNKSFDFNTQFTHVSRHFGT